MSVINRFGPIADTIEKNDLIGRLDYRYLSMEEEHDRLRFITLAVKIAEEYGEKVELICDECKEPSKDLDEWICPDCSERLEAEAWQQLQDDQEHS